ncbi:hypothetical protein Ae201684P_003372 [Aphanomyces euteiches]|nr:hypothetical protein Ae201684P_003372 [Aphanomyces euteiches]
MVDRGETLAAYCASLDASKPGNLLMRVANACMDIQQLIQRGALAENILGSAHSANVQGEVQQNLDILSNTIMVQACQDEPTLAGMCSEEREDIYATSHAASGQFLLLFDPLDGSSNIDVNVSIGTIFSVLPHATDRGSVSNSDFFQSGDRQIAAGYVIYGPQTILVLTVGDGVHMFTLDVAQRSFICTQPLVQLAPSTKEFAINMSNMRHWEPPIRAYVNDCLAGAQGKDFNMRWIASMVAEVHRILCRGGVFIYPWDERMEGRMAGRLRLLYEANPMCFLIEQAGGASSIGTKRIMLVTPQALHERVPVMLGAKEEIEVVERYHHEHQQTEP